MKLNFSKMDVTPIQSKTVTILYFLIVFAALFFTSRWVNKDLYIKSVVQQEEPAAEPQGPDSIPDSQEISAFEQITQEQMLQYLQRKYNEEFGCLSYNDGGLINLERMTAYPKNGSDLLDQFTIQREDDGTYTDGYLQVFARKKAQARLEEAVRKLMDSPDDVKVRASSIRLKENSKSAVESAPVLTGSFEICIPDEQWEAGASKLQGDALTNALKEAGLAGDVTVRALKMNHFEDLNLWDWDSYNTSGFITHKWTAEIPTPDTEEKEAKA